MTFECDRRFDSLTGAFTYILGQYLLQPNELVWGKSTSGLVYPRELPRYLFRGECGDFQTTMDSARRLQAESLRNGFRLSAIDLVKLGKLIFDLGRLFCRDPYGLDPHGAMGLLQHYGLPTRVVDFTACLNYAFAFAATEASSIARVAVMPRASSQTMRVVDFMDHRWGERPQRQGAFGVVTTDELADLKSQAARLRLNVKWYEFPVLPSDRDHFAATNKELIETSNDPSAGFLRFHITEYVEAFGKFSPALTEWLLEKIPIAPRCYRVQAFEGREVVINYRGADALQSFSNDAEAERSERYWSTAHADRSFDRMKNWISPEVGSTIADPRTYHPDV